MSCCLRDMYSQSLRSLVFPHLNVELFFLFGGCSLRTDLKAIPTLGIRRVRRARLCTSGLKPKVENLHKVLNLLAYHMRAGAFSHHACESLEDVDQPSRGLQHRESLRQ